MTDISAGAVPPVATFGRDDGGRMPQALLLSALLFLAAIIVGPKLLADPDTQWHIAIGAHIWNSGHLPQVDEWSHTFAGAPWIAKEWLSQLLLYGAFSLAGWPGVIILTALAIALTFGLLFSWLEARLKWVTALSVALAAWPLAAGQFLARPLVFALPILVLLVGALVGAVESRSRPPIWLVPLMTLWANLHASFPIAFVIFGIIAAEAVFSAEPGQRRQAMWQWGIVLVLMIAATGLTPYGFRPAFVTLFVFDSGEAMQYITEWQAPPLGFDFATAVPFAAAAACLGLLLCDPRRNWLRMLLVLVFAYLTVRHVRFESIFAIVAAIAVADSIRRIFPSVAPAMAGFPLAAAATLRLAAAATAVGLAVAAVTRPLPPPKVWPAAALDAAHRSGLNGPVFNDYDFGGFLLANGIRTFIDGRSDQLFVGGFFHRLSRALDENGSEAFFAMLSDYHVTWALVAASGKADVKLGKAADWAQVFRDQEAAVYSRGKTPVSPSPAAGNP